jgi:Zn-dependent M16 (insulinase) family peptidase
MKNKIFSAILAAAMIFNTAFTVVLAKNTAFELISTQKSDALNGTVYRYRHKKTGADVIYNANGSDRRQFVLGFKTPPVDSKGANHVLEHALFCGSEKYPTKNIMHYIQNGTSSLILNGLTADDCTYYFIQTANQTEYYNMIDVYMNGIFHPLFLTDENIFRQQGIRIEYAGGKAQYNGVVYNELRIKNLNTEENSVNFLADKLYRGIYGDTTPSFSAGGELDEIKNLTYDDLLRVYNTFYIPSNSMTYIAGNQDIDETLDILDGFFSENTAKAPDISFEDTRQIPEQEIQEYNVDENTKTVDIGFMFSGVPASAEPMDRYANEIVYDIIRQKMEEKGYSNMYTSGGNTGGVTNLALMISQIPKEDKDKVISDYNTVLADLDENGIDDSDIDKYVDNDDRFFFQNFDRVLVGLLYKDNPLAYTEVNAMREYFKSHKEYFTELLKKYFTENPYSVTVISGNGAFGAEDSSVNVSKDELEQIKRDTEAFQKWNDEEDDPSVIAKIPFLTLDEVKDAPQKAEPFYEEQKDIDFYFTDVSKAANSESVSLFFPLGVSAEDLDYVTLMLGFIQSQAEKAELECYMGVLPFENVNNSQELNPHFIIGLIAKDKSECLKELISFLQSDNLWNENDLKEYIQNTPSKILQSYYDPYFLSGELKDSALSASGNFFSIIPANTIVKGSPHYCHFLQSLDPNDSQTIISKIEAMANNIILNNKPAAEYIGENSEYEIFKDTVAEIFADGKKRNNEPMLLPIGYYSAATITKLADANHFMLTGQYEPNTYSGKMAVLGKVLSTKYITPTMRGKHGAYGSNITFREDEMTSAVTGLNDIDFALEIWQGMGDFLRNLNMTQNELNSFIVSAVQDFDEWDYAASEYGAETVLKHQSTEDCDKIRNEMLNTTVKDIKGYADFVDELVSQKRVFAVLGQQAADNAEFDFAYYGSDVTLEVTPRLTKKASGYINGKSDTEFFPDDNITRAETAVIISQLLADKRKPQRENTFNDIPVNAWYKDAVTSLCEKGIMSGYVGNLFKPEQAITRAELTSILSKFIFNGDSELKSVYSDLSKTAWYSDSMAKMINAGYISGYSDGTLRPDSYITRAEVTAIVNRMLNIKNRNTENPFSDVDRSHWAYNDILSAVK